MLAVRHRDAYVINYDGYTATDGFLNRFARGTLVIANVCSELVDPMTFAAEVADGCFAARERRCLATIRRGLIFTSTLYQIANFACGMARPRVAGFQHHSNVSLAP